MTMSNTQIYPPFPQALTAELQSNNFERSWGAKGCSRDGCDGRAAEIWSISHGNHAEQQHGGLQGSTETKSWETYSSKWIEATNLERLHSCSCGLIRNMSWQANWKHNITAQVASVTRSKERDSRITSLALIHDIPGCFQDISTYFYIFLPGNQAFDMYFGRIANLVLLVSRNLRWKWWWLGVYDVGLTTLPSGKLT